jgi:hypothetical protein
MTLYKLGREDIAEVPPTSFAEHGVLERQHLQRVLRAAVHVVAPDTMVLTEEFGEWADSARRIDLLAIDKEANLVVIELKRNDDGSHLDLQAIRYAAMVSTMTYARAVDVHRRYLQRNGREGDSAEGALLEFLGWDSPLEESFAQDVRIVLAAPNFSKEVTTAVMWLNERQLDIRCVRIQPYLLGDHLLVDVQQLIPLPEVANYQIELKEKVTQERGARQENARNKRDFTRYDIHVAGREYKDQWKRNVMFHVVNGALSIGLKRQQLGIPEGKWLIVESDCATTAEFAARVTQDGGKFEPDRWFAGDDELFHEEPLTFVLSNQWSGPLMLPLLESLAQRFPQLALSYSEAL